MSAALYLAAAAVLVLEYALLWLFMTSRKPTLPPVKPTDAQAEPSEEGAPAETSAAPAQPQTGSCRLRWAGICAAALLCSFCLFVFASVRDSGFLRALMDAVLFGWLAAAGYIDARERIIPNPLILGGLGFWLLLTALESTLGGSALGQVLVFSLLGGVPTFLVLFLVALIRKTGLGMGDVKLFSVLGLFYGLTGIYSILLFSVLLMAALAVVLLVLKKATMKTTLPMAPFAVAGFLLHFFFGV